MESLKRSLASVRRRYTLLRSTKENAYYSWTVHDVVTVPYAMRFHSLDAILDRPGTFRLDLMCSIFLARELVFIFCLLQVCLWFFSQFSIVFLVQAAPDIGKFPFQDNRICKCYVNNVFCTLYQFLMNSSNTRSAQIDQI